MTGNDWHASPVHHLPLLACWLKLADWEADTKESPGPTAQIHGCLVEFTSMELPEDHSVQL